MKKIENKKKIAADSIHFLPINISRFQRPLLVLSRRFFWNWIDSLCAVSADFWDWKYFSNRIIWRFECFGLWRSQQSIGSTKKSYWRPRFVSLGRRDDFQIFTRDFMVERFYRRGIFYCFNAVYKNNASAGRSNSVDCSAAIRKNSGIGILVCFVAGFERRNDFVNSCFDFQ